MRAQSRLAPLILGSLKPLFRATVFRRWLPRSRFRAHPRSTLGNACSKVKTKNSRRCRLNLTMFCPPWIAILYSLLPANRNTVPLIPSAEFGPRVWSRVRRPSHFRIPHHVRFPSLPIIIPSSRPPVPIQQPLLKLPHRVHTINVFLQDGSCTRWPRHL